MYLGTYIGLYLVSIPVFVLIDLLWIGVIARGLYQSELGGLLGSINWTAAAFLYLILLAGLTYFAIAPGFFENSVMRAVILGAFFGFVVYATYDLTNFATLKSWPLKIVLIDMLWGAVLGGAVSGVAVFLYRLFFGAL